jgi:hypothetical protein
MVLPARNARDLRWAARPITFRPPPAGWRREGDLGDGRRGVRFMKERSVGEAISVDESLPGRRPGRHAQLHQLGRRVGRSAVEPRSALARAHGAPTTRLPASERDRPRPPSAQASTAPWRRCARGDRVGNRARGDGGGDRGRGHAHHARQGGEGRVPARGPRARAHRAARTRITPPTPPARRVDCEVPARGPPRGYVMRQNHLFIASYIRLEPPRTVYEASIASMVFHARGVGT